MNVVRNLRQRAGLTQQEFAARAATSQSAIAAYETGRKSPQLATVERLAAAVGLELSWRLVSPMTRADRRSLALHAQIAEALRREPAARIAQARRCLELMRERNPDAFALLDAWDRWLRLAVDDLIDQMLDPGPGARDMRQVTPFAGALSARERAKAYRAFAREERRSHEAR